MNLETRARDAAESLRTATPVDTEDGLRRLHRTQHRRTTGKVIAAVAALVVGVGVVQVQLDENRTAPPVSPPPVLPPPGPWVLVTGTGTGIAGPDNVDQPTGDEWAEPLAEQGTQSYTNLRSADPVTRRFVTHDWDGHTWTVMTPGRREPLATIDPEYAVIIGPGPDELTEIAPTVVVRGMDWQIRRSVGVLWNPTAPAGGVSGSFAWSPDGETWTEARNERGLDRGSMTIVLRDQDSGEETSLYSYSEAAPGWYDADQHRYGDAAGEHNGWGAPQLADLRWAPDSTRLAFATTTTPLSWGGDRHVRWQLFVADPATGEVEQIADLGRCAEPVDKTNGYARVCDEQAPSLTWTPDGKSLTVLADSTLTTYDQTGKVLASEPTDLKGPIVWMTAQ